MLKLCIAKKLSLLFSWCLFVWLSFGAPVRGDDYPFSQQDFVVALDDKTFEHETQASTGQTTGSWLVWFHKRVDAAHILGTPPSEEFWADHHTIVGAVDVSKSELTKSRFKVRKVPTLLYIHKGKFYRYPKEPDYPFSWDSIARFVTEDYTKVEAEDIPPPRTFFHEITDYVNKMLTEGEMFFRLLAYIFGIMFVAVIINQVFIVDRSKKDKVKSS